MPVSPATFRPSILPAAAAWLAGVLLWLGLAASPCVALAQVQPQVQARPPANGASAAPAGRPVLKPAAAPKAKVLTKPLWTELTPEQRQALAPLTGQWDTLNEAQKRKWLALSTNYPRMSGAEQAKLHSRMTEWVSLSAQQRTQARLNFGETKQIPADDKKAKWEAYQALSPEEKRKLAAGAAKPPSTAAAVKPVAPDKLANVPNAKLHNKGRIVASPNQVDHNTLLPQQAPSPVSAPN